MPRRVRLLPHPTPPTCRLLPHDCCWLTTLPPPACCSFLRHRITCLAVCPTGSCRAVYCCAWITGFCAFSSHLLPGYAGVVCVRPQVRFSPPVMPHHLLLRRFADRAPSYGCFPPASYRTHQSARRSGSCARARVATLVLRLLVSLPAAATTFTPWLYRHTGCGRLTALRCDYYGPDSYDRPFYTPAHCRFAHVAWTCCLAQRTRSVIAAVATCMYAIALV